MKATQEKPWLQYYDPAKAGLPVPELSIMEYLKLCMEKRENNIALLYQDKAITNDELFKNIYATADAFAGMGVKKGDYVVVVSITTPEIVYTFYALSLLGAVPNMVDPRFSVKGIRNCINEVGARFVLTLTAAYEKVVEAVKGTKVEKTIVLSPVVSLPKIKQFLYGLKNKFPENMPENFIDWQQFMEYGKGVKAEHITDRAHECCIIVHTGGTTGPSKSVMLSDYDLNAISWEMKKTQMNRINSGHDSVLNIMPPFIAYGFGYGVHLPLCNYMTSIIIPALAPEKLGKLIKKYKPQEITGVPYHYQTLMQDPAMKGVDLSFLTKPCVGGDTLAIPVEKQINEWLKEHNAPCHVIKGYGMTELSACATACVLDTDKPGSVGIPNGGFMIAAFDPETGEEKDCGETGEICITGPTVMMGYYNNKEETDNIVRVHDDGLRWVHTGDIGYVDEDGFVFLNGRAKRVFMDWFGFKIFPAAIENVLALCNDVEYSCVVPAVNKEHVRGYVPFAFYTVKGACKKSEEELNAELKKLCENELPEYMQPKYFKKIDEMLRTPIGKTDFVSLEKMAAELTGTAAK